MRSTWASRATAFGGLSLRATASAIAFGSAVMCGLVPPAHAQDDKEEIDDATRNAAREMSREGVVAYGEGEYERAQDLLHRAYDLVPAPTIALYEARSLVQLGRLVEAAERYELVKRTKLEDDASEAFIQSVEDAGVELAELRPRIPRLTIVVEGPPAGDPLVVKLDGVVVPAALVGVARTVDPGTHLVEATHPDFKPARSEVSVVEGQASEVVLPLVVGGPAPPPPPDDGEGIGTQEAIGYGALGVGIVGLGIGLVSGIMMSGHQSDLDDQCPNDVCPPEAQGDLDAFRSARTVSFIGYGVGIVGIGAGVALLLLAPTGPLSLDTGRVVPWMTHDSVGVTGTF